MSNLADRIEVYLKKILDETDEGFVVLQRGVLAGEFSCAPSQINYVLGTRFTVERGYLVESRRGGGGYLRIVRLGWNHDSQFQNIIRQLIGDQLTYERALGLLKRLLEEAVVSNREAALIRTMLHPESLNSNVLHPDMLRAHIMKQILTTLSREDLS